MCGGPDAAPHGHIERPSLRVLGQETADKGVASAVGVNNSVKNIWLEKVVDNLLNIQGKHFYTIAKGITDTRGQMS